MTSNECCDHHHHHHRYHHLFRPITLIILILVLILLSILLTFLILHPTKPRFTLQDTSIYSFNLTQPNNLLTTSLQVTLSTRNPNDKIGVYYDHVDVYISYHNQQITLPTRLPPTYQGHKDIIVWSPFVYGQFMPISPFLCMSLEEDWHVGRVLVNVRVSGKVKWKVGSWISGYYRLNVNCPAYINFGGANDLSNIKGDGDGGGGGGGGSGGIDFGEVVKYQLGSSCVVDV